MIQSRHKKGIIFGWGLTLMLFFLLSGALLSQTTLVTLEGKVTDDKGEALPGATVIARDMETGYTKSTITRNDGTYIISGLQPGKYELEVNLSGFDTKVKKGFTFNVGSRHSINFTLIPSTLEEKVTVTAESPMVEVTKSEVSKVVDRSKIDSLPMLERDFGDLTIMKAGVQGERSNAQPSGSGEMMIDGVSNEWVGRNTVRSSIPADAIQEFRVMTNQYEAEYGNASGMIRSAITRSGTNDWRGRLAFFYRDDYFDDVNYFVDHEEYKGPKLSPDEYEKPEFSRYNYSGFLGGPIVKDKLHFFLAYEGLTYKDNYTVNIPIERYPKETFPRSSGTNMVMAKLNYQLNEKNLFTVRYGLDRPTENDYGAGGTYHNSSRYDRVEYTHELQANWTYYPSNNTMNELRVLFSRNKYDYEVPDKTAYTISRPSGTFGPSTNLPQWASENRIQFAENFSIFIGDHSIKLGIDASSVRMDGEIYQYYPGYYIFATNEPFDPNKFSTYPYLLVRSPEIATLDTPYSEAAVFAQDSWKIHPRLTLNYGLRWNYYTCENLDINNFSLASLNPRFGFSWDPVGDGKTAIRGGVGTYSQNPQLNLGLLVGLMDALEIQYYFYPGYPDPSVPNPFIPSIPYEPPVTTYRGQENHIPPYTVQTTLGFKREFFTDVSLGFDLVWSKGVKFSRFENKNPVIPGTSIQREDPTKGDEWVITSNGKSDYKGLYVTFTKRYSHGWSLDVAYTLSRSWSDVETEQSMPYDYEEGNWDRMYGPNNADATHRLSVSGIVDLPLGFQLTGISYYRSATPWSAFYVGDVNKDSRNYDLVDEHRNARRGFDSFWLNVRISKYVTISQYRFQFFGEIYNVTDRANFSDIHNRYKTENFGEPMAAGDPRLIQFGFRIDF